MSDKPVLTNWQKHYEAAVEDRKLEDRRETHLLDWLFDGFTHCKFGSKEWCQSYLTNARETIIAQDAEIASLRGRVEELTRENEALRSKVGKLEEDIDDIHRQRDYQHE